MQLLFGRRAPDAPLQVGAPLDLAGDCEHQPAERVVAVNRSTFRPVILLETPGSYAFQDGSDGGRLRGSVRCTYAVLVETRRGAVADQDHAIRERTHGVPDGNPR